MVKYNVAMSNSFYYFFSATPQVLAGILALFGVFIIFKIQTLKSELIGIGQYILEKGNRLIRIPSIDVKLKIKLLKEMQAVGIYVDIQNAIDKF